MLPLLGRYGFFAFVVSLMAFLYIPIWVLIAYSLYVAAGATILTLRVGVPAALALYRFHFPGKNLFRRVMLLPITLSGIVTGISMPNIRSAVVGAGLLSFVLSFDEIPVAFLSCR